MSENRTTEPASHWKRDSNVVGLTLTGLLAVAVIGMGFTLGSSDGWFVLSGFFLGTSFVGFIGALRRD